VEEVKGYREGSARGALARSRSRREKPSKCRGPRIQAARTSRWYAEECRGVCTGLIAGHRSTDMPMAERGTREEGRAKEGETGWFRSPMRGSRPRCAPVRSADVNRRIFNRRQRRRARDDAINRSRTRRNASSRPHRRRA